MRVMGKFWGSVLKKIHSLLEMIHFGGKRINPDFLQSFQDDHF
jgi:hypothetical protein